MTTDGASTGGDSDAEEPTGGEPTETGDARSGKNRGVVVVTVTVLAIIGVLVATVVVPTLGVMEQRWSRSVGSVEDHTYRTYVHDGSLVRVTARGVAAYRLDTGARQWWLPSRNRAQPCATAPEPSGGVLPVLYGTAVAGRFLCHQVRVIDLDKGKPLWTEQLTQDAASGVDPRFSVTVAGDVVVATDGTRLTGFAVRTGKLSWQQAPPAGCNPAGVRADGRRLLGTLHCYNPDGFPIDAVLWSLAPDTGVARWKRKVPSTRASLVNVDPPVVQTEGDGLYAFDGNGERTARVPGVNKRTGVRVEHGTFGTFDANPVSYARVVDGLLVGQLATRGGNTKVVAYRLADGSRSWIADLGRAPMTPVLSDETGRLTFLYGGDDEDEPQLVDVDARTGSVDRGAKIELPEGEQELPTKGMAYRRSGDWLVGVRTESTAKTKGEPEIQVYR